MKIKEFACLVFFSLTTFVLDAQDRHLSNDSFQFDGTVSTSIDYVKLVKYQEGALTTLDSVKIENGLFRFEGKINAPEVYYLEFDSNFKLPVFVESSKISVGVEGLSMDSIFISGSGIHEEWLTIQNLIQKYDDLLDTIRNQYYKAKEEGNDSLKETISNEYDAFELKKETAIDSIIRNNAHSYVSPYLVVKYKMYSGDPTVLEIYRNQFGSSILNSPYVAIIDRRINILNLTKVGNQIPNFTLPDTTGVLISIEDFRGQFVLIDFWASWCGPCRRENPNIVAAHDKYKESGFTVLGVSLDKEREAWLKAIKKDELEWTQVSDLNGWNNEVAKMFGVRSIPFCILINPEGIIVAKNLHGEDLHLELNKYFGK